MTGCKFCQIVAGLLPAEIVFQLEAAAVVLDHRPLRLGHCLVVPCAHYETLLDVPRERLGGLFACVQLAARAVEIG